MAWLFPRGSLGVPVRGPEVPMTEAVSPRTRSARRLPEAAATRPRGDPARGSSGPAAEAVISDFAASVAAGTAAGALGEAGVEIE